MSEPRFQVVSHRDAVKRGFPDAEPDTFDNLYWDLYEFNEQGQPIRWVGSDGGEPEDQLLVRDWKWVVEELNRERCAREQAEARVQALQARLDKLERFHEVVVAFSARIAHRPSCPWPDDACDCGAADILDQAAACEKEI